MNKRARERERFILMKRATLTYEKEQAMNIWHIYTQSENLHTFYGLRCVLFWCKLYVRNKLRVSMWNNTAIEFDTQMHIAVLLKHKWMVYHECSECWHKCKYSFENILITLSPSLSMCVSVCLFPQRLTAFSLVRFVDVFKS